MASGGQFDPFNQARLPAPPLEGKGEERLVEMNSMNFVCHFSLMFTVLRTIQYHLIKFSINF